MKNSLIREIIEWLLCILIAIVLALLVRYYLGTPTKVQQPSMFPTLKENNRLILNRTIRFNKNILKKGDIVTFESPSKVLVSSFEADINNPIAEYDRNFKNIFEKFAYYILEITKDSYIKRIIAVEGEHIEIKDGKVYINGELLEEEYLSPNITTNSLDGAYTNIVVPKGCVFVMGDNRGHSTDSRRFGCVPLEKIESKVLIRFWPFDVFGKIK